MATVSKILICSRCGKSYDITYLVLDSGLQRLNEYLDDDCPNCEGLEKQKQLWPDEN